jgi:hypothetical protein
MYSLSTLSSMSAAFAGKPTPTPDDIRRHCDSIANDVVSASSDASPSYMFQPPADPIIDEETVQVN